MKRANLKKKSGCNSKKWKTWLLAHFFLPTGPSCLSALIWCFMNECLEPVWLNCHSSLAAFKFLLKNHVCCCYCQANFLLIMLRLNVISQPALLWWPTVPAFNPFCQCVWMLFTAPDVAELWANTLRLLNESLLACSFMVVLWNIKTVLLWWNSLHISSHPSCPGSPTTTFSLLFGNSKARMTFAFQPSVPVTQEGDACLKSWMKRRAVTIILPFFLFFEQVRDSKEVITDQWMNSWIGRG